MAKTKPSSQCNLFPTEVASDGVVVLNARCRLRREGDETVVLMSGFPVAHFSDAD
jgi:hypothetical protein